MQIRGIISALSRRITHIYLVVNHQYNVRWVESWLSLTVFNLSEKDTKHAMLKDFDSPFDINVDLYK